MSKGSKRTSEVGGSGRWSAKRKAAAVLRLLKGEDLDTVSRELKVTASTLSEWREVFLANGLAGLKSREVDGRDEQIAALKKALGRALDLAISREIIRAYGESRPLVSGKSTS
jgi:transposase-like protein